MTVYYNKFIDNIELNSTAAEKSDRERERESDGVTSIRKQASKIT